MKPTKKAATVTLKVPEGLVAAINILSERQYRSRSDIIRQGVIRELEANGICCVAAA